MKMILAIIQDSHVNVLAKALMDRDIRITRLASTGGFFKSGNSTLLIGVEDEQVEMVKNIVEAVSTKERLEEENVHAVNMFILNVDSYERI
ncbi:MAG: hypothetical protein GXZ11_06345 [Tissierellia bacterium]|nr:hypothetical protein [Tissierellia bacterium]